jgi:hypothetical protein
MKSIRLLILQLTAGLIAALLFLPTAQAGGSRVGNGNGNGGKTNSIKISIDKSFEIESTFPFTQLVEFQDGVRIEGLPEVRIKSGSFTSLPQVEKQKIDFMKLSEQRPELVKLPKVDLDRFFKTNKWNDLSIDSTCAVAKFIETPEFVTVIISWGQNKGFVASTPNSTSSKKALLDMAKSTFIYEKGCTWK